MKKRLLAAFIIMALTASCAVHKYDSKCVLVYWKERFGASGLGPTYLILRAGSLYEFYKPENEFTSSWGTFKISNDTLCLWHNKYYYYHEGGEIQKEFG